LLRFLIKVIFEEENMLYAKHNNIGQLVTQIKYAVSFALFTDPAQIIQNSFYIQMFTIKSPNNNPAIALKNIYSNYYHYKYLQRMP
jgi:hypothetical protein